MKRTYIKWIIFIIIIILICQILKIYVKGNEKFIEPTLVINGVLNITYVENTGGAWGIGSGNIAKFIAINILVIAIIIRFMITQKDRMTKISFISLSLILSGGIGNFIDRLLRGYVIDYIDINPLFNFPVFNLEDILIVAGWIMFVADVSIKTIKLKDEKVEDKIEEISDKQ